MASFQCLATRLGMEGQGEQGRGEKSRNIKFQLMKAMITCECV